jgi:hypothetical protein
MAKGFKSGGSKKGSRKHLTKSVKDAVIEVFHEVNGEDNNYLRDMAKNDPKLFAALFSKMIPAAVEATVTHSVDLGSALITAQARLDAIEHDPLDSVGPSIDKPTLSEPVPTSPDLEAPVPPPLDDRPYLLDEKFDYQLNEYGELIKGDG